MKDFLVLAFTFLSFCLSAQVEEETMVPIDPVEEVEGHAAYESDDVFVIVQEMPEFPGGKEAMNAFIAQHQRYPADARKANEQGLVYVQVIINKDGCIDSTSINVLRGLSPSIDEEAVRVVKEMPCWSPGTQRDVPVRVKISFPIRFALK